MPLFTGSYVVLCNSFSLVPCCMQLSCVRYHVVFPRFALFSSQLIVLVLDMSASPGIDLPLPAFLTVSICERGNTTHQSLRVAKTTDVIRTFKVHWMPSDDFKFCLFVFQFLDRNDQEVLPCDTEVFQTFLRQAAQTCPSLNSSANSAFKTLSFGPIPDTFMPLNDSHSPSRMYCFLPIRPPFDVFDICLAYAYDILQGIQDITASECFLFQAQDRTDIPIFQPRFIQDERCENIHSLFHQPLAHSLHLRLQGPHYDHANSL